MDVGFSTDRAGVPEEVMKKYPYITPELRRNYEVSLVWIQEHWDELLAHGWTRDKFFSIGDLPYPLGMWGIAWFSLWTKKDTEIALTSAGDLACVLHEPGGDVVQTMRKDLIP